ncbi:uncharacterized protein METZ01_LOCUS253741 [marine metagenome]|uniref:Uncharacterized protein n=1 Tax=marine metagenome TaxID=408172 RepID=A0A382INU9_9ZZZZ
MNINLPIFQQINLQSSREFYIILVKMELGLILNVTF